MTTFTANTRKEIRRLAYPWWRRITAFLSLGSIVVIVGISVAALIAAFAMLSLYIVEQAVG